MSPPVLRCRAPARRPRLPDLDASAAAVEARLEDAAHRRGAAEAVCAPADEGEWAGLLSCGRPVLVVGAQSSLTGGATPQGGLVATTDHLRGVLQDGGGSHLRVQPGLSLHALQARLRPSGRWFPPVPTWDGAFVGGAVSTDAAGARTFACGTTRRWVRGLTAMLPGGDVVELERGQVVADEQGRFILHRANGARAEVQLPMHRLPDVPKCSAGYRGGPGLDLVDLFVGSEGTLAALLEIELDVAPRAFAELGLLVPMPDEAAGLAAVAALRELAQRGAARVAAIEFLDAACVAMAREDGVEGVPQSGDWLLLVQAELPEDLSSEDVVAQLAGEAEGPAAAIARALEAEGGRLGEGLAALPGDERAFAALAAVREAAPQGVNERIGRARRETGEEVVKVGGDLIVPFERLGELLAAAREGAVRRGLELAVWGHVSDGNVHPNVVARSAAEVEAGEELLLELGRLAIALGGSPLAEHGVGRHPLKQRLLRELVGDEALAAMRGVKRAFDPQGVLAPGVLL